MSVAAFLKEVDAAFNHISVAPTFSQDGYSQMPAYLTRTNTQYWRAPFVETLHKRGISNRMLESLFYSLPDGSVIAGGFMLSIMNNSKEHTGDIDVFFTSEEAFKKAVQVLVDPASHAADDDPQAHWAVIGYQPDEKTKEALKTDSWKKVRYLKFTHEKNPPIQLIKMAWYQSAEHIIDSFDLTCVQFALDVTTGDLVANPVSFIDAKEKRLILHRMQWPAATLRRVIKYGKRGYYATPGALVHLAEEVAKHVGEDAALGGDFYSEGM